MQVAVEAAKLKAVARVVAVGLLSSADIEVLQVLATYARDTVVAVSPAELIPLASSIIDAAASTSTDKDDYEATTTYKSYCMKGNLCFVNTRVGVLYTVSKQIESPVIPGIPGPVGPAGQPGPIGISVFRRRYFNYS